MNYLMKNSLFKEALNQVSTHTTEKIQKYTDMIDEFQKIIDDAYKLYMPQVRSEITDLTNFLIQNTGLKDGRPINVLEIGTKYGGTFYIWNKLNEVFGRDKEHWYQWGWSDTCISIDMSDGGLHGGISEEEMDKRDLWFNERFENCHFIRGDSHSEKTQIEFLKLIGFKILNRSKDDKDRIDLLFIDGDHSYEGVKQDFLDYSPFVNKGGLICFHDTVISDRHHERNVYVGEFWRDLTKVRMSDNPNICMIDSQLYEVFEFVNGNENWGGVGALIKL
jgi:cephalosporin hydroxylase